MKNKIGYVFEDETNGMMVIKQTYVFDKRFVEGGKCNWKNVGSDDFEIMCVAFFIIISMIKIWCLKLKRTQNEGEDDVPKPHPTAMNQNTTRYA